MTDRGPIFFWQMRVGQWGAEFPFPKFRSMVLNAEALKNKLLAQNDHANGITFKMKKDPRVTWIGRISAKRALTNSPGLECSQGRDVFGWSETASAPRSCFVHAAGPAATGCKTGADVYLAGEREGDIPFDRQVELDVQYIESQSLWLDLVLLLKTAPASCLEKAPTR